MKKNVLGRTGIEVTELCFGALPMGPLQKNMSVEDCTEVIAHALEKGINFIDTAQMYKTYDPIRKALKKTGKNPVISTKSTASSYEDMEKAVNEALEKLERNYIDIFFLHAARVETDVFEVRKGALECLLSYKKRGIIKAVGISTHNVKVVELAAERDDIDVVFPIINKKGIGILSGSTDDMIRAIKLCSEKGKGVLLMKVLGGGILINNYKEALDFARKIEGYHSIAIGMVSKEEVDFNIDYFNGIYDEGKMPSFEGYLKRYMVVDSLCKGCKTCLSACPNMALEFDERRKKAYINQEKCLTCGYCTASCPEFAIRVI
ncbi:MAG: aldo/keto reductase [Thermovenabulum sp.]|uniref:aldo/keto reductase n=1 Tax=Thermovenabulum sp. TaxID=3100335 RepID=UPI003C7B468D